MASMQESRLVVATTDDGIVDYGVLQRGYEYRVSVPLTLRGAKAAPTRYRVHVEQSSGHIPSSAPGQATRTMPVGTSGAAGDLAATPNFLVRVMSGGVGRLMAGLPCLLELVVEGYRPGVVDAVVVIVSEGGESRFRVRGHMLDGGTYRAFAKTQLQLSHQHLARKGVTRIGQTTSDKHRPVLETDAGASSNDASTVFSQLAEPSVGADHANDALPVCPEADAVERLLSAEEAEELASFPMLSGCYFDRLSQTVKMSPTSRKAWLVDLSVPLDTVAARYDAEREADLKRLELKGFVTDRVVRRMRQKKELGIMFGKSTRE